LVGNILGVIAGVLLFVK